MNVFFGKTQLTNRFIVSGAAVHFDPIDGNRGIRTLDDQTDAALVEALTKASREQRGGILKFSSQQDFEDFKKKALLLPPRAPFYPSGLKRRDLLQVATPLPKKPSQSPLANANVAAVKPAPVVTVSPPATPAVPDGTVPKPFRPKTKPLKISEPT